MKFTPIQHNASLSSEVTKIREAIDAKHCVLSCNRADPQFNNHSMVKQVESKAHSRPYFGETGEPVKSAANSVTGGVWRQMFGVFRTGVLWNTCGKVARWVG